MATPNIITKHPNTPQDGPTPALNPNSDASSTSLELPTGGASMALALNPAPDASSTSLELLARGVSDLVKKHLSVEDRLQEQQDKWHHRMKDQEAMWSQRLREVEDTWYQRLRKETANWYQREEEKAEKLEARFFQRLQDARADWEQLNAQKNRAALESVDKIAKLKAALLLQSTAYSRLSSNFTLRAALERIVGLGKTLHKFGDKNPSGIQQALDILANTDAFKTIMDAEVEARDLVEKDVKRCIGLVYHEASKHAHGFSGMATIYHEDHVVNEVAALVCFMKLQSGWTNGLDWREVAKREFEMAEETKDHAEETDEKAEVTEE